MFPADQLESTYQTLRPEGLLFIHIPLVWLALRVEPIALVKDVVS